MKELLEFLDKHKVDYRVENGKVIGKVVYLSNRWITELPKDIGLLECEWLDLYNNEITELPISIGDIKCRRIYLNNNKIKELPISIGNLICSDIYLHYNNIPKSGIKYFDRIENLKNILTDYSDDLETIKQLCISNTRKEKIDSILNRYLTI